MTRERLGERLGKRLRQIALVALTTAAAVTLFCSVVDTPWTPQVFAAAVVVFPIALMLLGASQAGRMTSRVLWTLGSTFVVLASSMAGLFWTQGSQAKLWGLPAGAVLLVVGLFAVPLALSTLGFAMTFDGKGSKERDPS